MSCRASRALATACAPLVAVLACLPPGARAQEVRVDGVVAFTDHDLLGTPAGFGASLTVHPHARVGVRAAYERMEDDFGSFGSTCVGLVPPGQDCSGEPRSDASTVRAIGLAAPVRVWAGERALLSVVPGVRWVRVGSDQRGQRTGRVRAAAKDMFGVEAGVEVTGVLLPRWPLRVHVAGHAGTAAGESETVADGYTPFNGDVAFARLHLGVSLAF